MKNLIIIAVYLIASVSIGFALDLTLTDESHFFTITFLVIGIIMIISSAKFLDGQYLHGYTPDKNYHNDLSPGFHLVPLGFLPWSVVSYTSKIFYIEKPFTMAKAASDNRPMEYRIQAKANVALRIVNQRAFYENTGLKSFTGSESHDFKEHVMKDIITSLTQLGWRMGYKQLMQDADWSLERLERMISHFGLRDMLNETLAMYGLELISINLEVDLESDVINSVQDVFKAEHEKEAMKKRAEGKAEATRIQAQADADAKSIKDKRLSKDLKETAELFLGIGKGTITEQDALDLASAALDVYGYEFFFKNSGATNIGTDIANKMLATFHKKNK